MCLAAPAGLLFFALPQTAKITAPLNPSCDVGWTVSQYVAFVVAMSDLEKALLRAVGAPAPAALPLPMVEGVKVHRLPGPVRCVPKAMLTRLSKNRLLGLPRRTGADVFCTPPPETPADDPSPEAEVVFHGVHKKLEEKAVNNEITRCFGVSMFIPVGEGEESERWLYAHQRIAERHLCTVSYTHLTLPTNREV